MPPGEGAVGAARERAVLVAVDFTSGRPGVSPAARQARAAAALDRASRGEAPLPETAEPSLSRDLEFDLSLAEFQELARSAEAEIAAVLVQHRPRPDPATLVGGGKLDEIDATARATEADLVLFDHDLSPSQLRNLEARLPCRVIDRTQLILDIFARHARTREGQLQVELAQLEYQLPRLAGRGKTMSQLGGGIGTRGPGETQLETDRRRINTRIDRIRQQLEAVRRIRRQQRGRREAVPVPTVALVGYTNAGKSTLFNALTGAEVLASERMFATLDPKLRQLTLPSRRKVLLSDTVGFIRKLPHSLVTSFRATLEEVERAELLLHVRDAASPLLEEQRLEVEAVLRSSARRTSPRCRSSTRSIFSPKAQPRPCPPARSPSPRSRAKGSTVCSRPSTPRSSPTRSSRRTSPSRSPRAASSPRWNAAPRCSTKRYEGNNVTLTAWGPTSLLGRYRRYQRNGDNRADGNVASGFDGNAANNNTGRLSGERR